MKLLIEMQVPSDIKLLIEMQVLSDIKLLIGIQLLSDINLVIGIHGISRNDAHTYTEMNVGIANLGWKKYRFLRVDYVHSLARGKSEEALMFGLSF